MKKIIIGMIILIAVIAIGIGLYFMLNSNREEKSDETNRENANTEFATNKNEENQEDETYETKSGSKTLVVYFSAQSHTKSVAEKIAKNLDADIFEIVPEKIYTSEDLDWTDDNSRVSKEHDDESLRDVKLEKESEKRANIKYMPEPFETKRQHILGDTDDSDHVVREETIYNKPSVTPSVMKETNKYNVQNLPEVSQNDTLKTDEKVSAPLQQEVTDVYENFLSDIAKPKHNIIGQVFDTYWIVQYNEKMYIIDQHAAHEKVMFESLMEKRKTGQIHTQMISPPIILNLSMNEADLIQRYLQNFKEIGFEIEPFGGQDFAVRGVPTDLYTLDSQEVLMEIIDNLSNESAKMSPDILTDKIASMSCKAAVKGNNRMSFREADELITQLLSLENPYNCPHGRPTIISMSKYELEKKFKRII